MRFSLLVMLGGFLLFAIYLGWEQGAFSMKKMELRTQSASMAGYSSEVSSLFNQALKSPIQPLMKKATIAEEVLLSEPVASSNDRDNKNNKIGGSSLY